MQIGYIAKHKLFQKVLTFLPLLLKKLKNYFPHLDFEVVDFTTDLPKFKQYDCILLSEIVWYILPKLKDVFKILEQDFKGRYLLVN